jgi:hypothetical protein
MFAVPIGELLIRTSGLQHGGVITGATDELQANRKIPVRETAWHRKGGEAAEITDSAERVGVGEAFGEIESQRRRGNGK